MAVGTTRAMALDACHWWAQVLELGLKLVLTSFASLLEGMTSRMRSSAGRALKKQRSSPLMETAPFADTGSKLPVPCSMCCKPCSAGLSPFHACRTSQYAQA